MSLDREPQTAARLGADISLSANLAPGQPLPPALLYRRSDPAELPFGLCTELEEAPGLIGQERAVEALNFALRMRGKGYNVYALGAGGTGRHRMVEDLLRRKAESEPTPPDWCYVNNFGDPQQPRRMQLPPGRGLGLAAAMKALIDELRAALPAAFERDEYRARREAIEQQFRQRSEQAFGVLQRQAESKNIALLPTPTGLALAPARSGKVMSLDVFNELPAADREQFQHEIEAIQTELEATMRQVPLWEREHRDAVQALNRETTGFAIAHRMDGTTRRIQRSARGQRSISTASNATSRRMSTTFWHRQRRRAAHRSPAQSSAISRIRGSAVIRSTSSSTTTGSTARRSFTRTTRPIRRWSAGSSTWRVSAPWSPISIC